MTYGAPQAKPAVFCIAPMWGNIPHLALGQAGHTRAHSLMAKDRGLLPGWKTVKWH